MNLFIKAMSKITRIFPQFIRVSSNRIINTLHIQEMGIYAQTEAGWTDGTIKTKTFARLILMPYRSDREKICGDENTEVYKSVKKCLDLTYLPDDNNIEENNPPKIVEKRKETDKLKKKSEEKNSYPKYGWPLQSIN